MTENLGLGRLFNEPRSYVSMSTLIVLVCFLVNSGYFLSRPLPLRPDHHKTRLAAERGGGFSAGYFYLTSTEHLFFFFCQTEFFESVICYCVNIEFC